ncbi:hypothetical protein AgCh_033831 [Apium graveolens]
MSNSCLSTSNEVEDETGEVLVNHYYQEDHVVVKPTTGLEKQRTRRNKKKSRGESSGFNKKRKLSDEQGNMLELHFQTQHKLDSQRKDRIASQLGLDARQVAVWFQNRRARWKTKKLQEEYLRLKTQHECTVSEKCLLNSQVHEAQAPGIKEVESIQKKADLKAKSVLQPQTLLFEQEDIISVERPTHDIKAKVKNNDVIIPNEEDAELKSLEKKHPSYFINLFDGRMDFFGHSEALKDRDTSNSSKNSSRKNPRPYRKQSKLEHRLTLQEAIGSILHSQSPKAQHNRRPRDYEKREYRSPRQSERIYSSRALQLSFNHLLGVWLVCVHHLPVVNAIGVHLSL